MVATSAFGSGIVNPSVRAVLHVEGATNLPQFVQESGRAGSFCPLTSKTNSEVFRRLTYDVVGPL
jgi:hypothetical protein